MADEDAARQADATQVTLAQHNPDWARMAQAEAARIAAALGAACLRVEHIGSTAIPGILAKPTIDLMPVVTGIAEADTKQAAVERLGYLWRGEFGIPGRRYCVLEHKGKRLFHMHIFADQNANIATQIAFRDYLRAHRDEALAYEAAKRAAAAAHPWNSLAYNEHKSEWIRACQQRAKAWAERT